MDKKVVVVDDEEVICSLIQDVLGEKGFEVITRGTCSEGLEAITQEKPDLIILDINIPDRSGCGMYALLSEREDTKHIPVIFITGYIDKDEAEETGNTLAGQVLLTKPFDIKDLVEKVEEALKRA